MSLAHDIRGLTASVSSGEWPGEGPIAAVGQRLRTEAGALEPADLTELITAWQELAVAVEQAQREIARRLGRLEHAQRALKGYAHLRPHHQGQRVRERI